MDRNVANTYGGAHEQLTQHESLLHHGVSASHIARASRPDLERPISVKRVRGPLCCASAIRLPMVVGDLRRFGALSYRAPLPTQICHVDSALDVSLRQILIREIELSVLSNAIDQMRKTQELLLRYSAVWCKRIVGVDRAKPPSCISGSRKEMNLQ
jgi:hypothetical protein